MAPREGFEPPTFRLTAERSTVELPRNGNGAGEAPEAEMLGGAAGLVNQRGSARTGHENSRARSG